MQNSIAPFFRALPRGVTVVCGSETISLNYQQPSVRGRCVARAELPYGLDSETLHERLSQFHFSVARLRYEASRS